MKTSPVDWCWISDYEGIYEIHPDGLIRSVDRVSSGKHGKQKVVGKDISPILHKKTGYFVVNLAKNGAIKQYRFHILIAKHFIPNPKNKPTVNHILGIKSLNAAKDLEWATHQEQMDHAKNLGLTASGTRNGGSKLTESDIHKAFKRCMSGEEVIVVTEELGLLSRNTLPRAFRRMGYGEIWKEEALRRKSLAAHKRWDT